jgi:hypothetical protein
LCFLTALNQALGPADVVAGVRAPVDPTQRRVTSAEEHEQEQHHLRFGKKRSQVHS